MSEGSWQAGQAGDFVAGGLLNHPESSAERAPGTWLSYVCWTGQDGDFVAVCPASHGTGAERRTPCGNRAGNHYGPSGVSYDTRSSE